MLQLVSSELKSQALGFILVGLIKLPMISRSVLNTIFTEVLLFKVGILKIRRNQTQVTPQEILQVS